MATARASGTTATPPTRQEPALQPHPHSPQTRHPPQPGPPNGASTAGGLPPPPLCETPFGEDIQPGTGPRPPTPPPPAPVGSRGTVSWGGRREDWTLGRFGGAKRVHYSPRGSYLFPLGSNALGSALTIVGSWLLNLPPKTSSKGQTSRRSLKERGGSHLLKRWTDWG